MAKISEIILDESLISEPMATPEHVMWLAVIERAMLDYIYPGTDLTPVHRHSLVPFFFEDEPKPHNLIYICNILFEYPDATQVIRDRIIQLHKKNPTAEPLVRSKRYKGYY